MRGDRRGPGGRPEAQFRRLAILAPLAGFVFSGAASAQDTALVLPSQLPRPGYQQEVLRWGDTTLASEIGVEARYDSNIFAVSSAPIDDVIIRVTPRFVLETDRQDYLIHSELFADIRQYVDNSGESRTAFGALTKANYSFDRSSRIAGGIRAERLVQSRNDPEALDRIGLTPRLINAITGDLGYRRELGRTAIDLRGGVERLAYLADEDADRSLVTMRADLRASRSLRSGIAWFVDGYVNRRDNDTAVDRSGVDRDATTIGATTGASLAISGQWSGEAGLGVFRSNPDDSTLDSFTGVAAKADLTYSPNPRTAITLEAFSGDVATVRQGAIGRVDSRIALRLDQEVRHNLLLKGSLGYLETSFRRIDNDQQSISASIGAEYLMNRYASIYVDLNHVDRNAEQALEAFQRTYVGVGFRLRH